MAILSKIRERSMALILVIGLALFAFVLDPSSIQDFFNSSNINTVGEVGGETISRKEFSEALEAYRAQYGSQITEMQASNDVWNTLIRQKVYQTQLAKSGITVGEADVWNALIETSSIQEDPQFQNAAGMFDQERLKEFLATVKEDPNQIDTWTAWTNYMAQIKDNLEYTTYNSLITAGLGASLKEGEFQYFNNNTKISADYVFVPYTSVSDSLINVTKSEIEDYIKKNEDQFKVEETRNLKLVKFNILPTANDETEIKEELSSLLEDKGDLKGFKNTEDLQEFFAENDSDLPLTNTYSFKNTVSAAIAENVFNGKEGDVFGPYKDNGSFKISKITEIRQMPDSVRASHILIPFIGSLYADQDTKKTEEQAKKTADSIYSLVRRNKTRFASIADEINIDMTKGKGGDIDWITTDVAFSPNFDADFADYLFFNKAGSVGVIKSRFGYQIIRIDESKNKQKAVKLATFSRQIEASTTTENTVFQNAETFALALSNGQAFDVAAKEKQLNVQPVIGLRVLDENIPGVGRQRDIVQWAFDSDNEIGDYKRFDVNGGYVVAVLSGQTEKGLMSAVKAAPIVKPILINQKKAKMIGEKMQGATLDAIAKNNATIVQSEASVSMQSPILTGVGFEPKLIGAFAAAKENTLFTNVAGEKGVFAFEVTKKELPVALPNYDTYRKRIEAQRKTQTNFMYEAIKKSANIEDNRAAFYGIN
ncbi:peptidylprolyl isomerase [Polaribacter pacificus]|uniref:Periplasmic chaperone PpiD n=1 Tax=Polaribacter pacificus TaxID=1775173 RepID=A0A917MCX9_9FLAO|nr:peptidylprolyl isomerase [Polaribacter pacificus]GGG96930.1 peptidylprolyl isomerase [Polaribacter pacificus]